MVERFPLTAQASGLVVLRASGASCDLRGPEEEGSPGQQRPLGVQFRAAPVIPPS